MTASAAPSFGQDLRHIAALAWPVFVGQIAVLAFATIDTLLLARHDARDLAALAVGSAAYISVFIGLMGVVLAVGPIAGRLFGARRLAEAGQQLQQALWLALALSVPGCVLLAFPQPFLWLAQAAPEVAQRTRGYMAALAFALPAALAFAAFRGFNTAVSRPKAVMVLQLGALLLKLPLSWLLVFGQPGLGLPALGVTGCGIATALLMWVQALAALALLRRDPFYKPFQLRRWGRPRRAALAAQLKLGIPMGLAIVVEVTGFTFMAFFISRLGTLPVAGHQIAANLAGLLYMLPLAIGNACGTLVAQRIGAQDPAGACRLGWRGVQIAATGALLLGLLLFLARPAIVALYTHEAAVVAAALPLLGWLALFHLGDAVQAVVASVLRAWHVTTLPMLIYALAVWVLGLGGGYVLAFDLWHLSPALQGARGFWAAAAAGLIAAALALTGVLARVGRSHPRQTASH
ncbi:MATE family efflux transporter [Azohydromonas caseinilytica]|uniref:MATE family efflux transporter n=1 Tax=Azohydromonas caseinilytica TaxID=2728836 RepID=A0A848FFM2_9BURK|nr:MATE family efflux transporter [Azohydromonas caseinilytica]NML19027.1 MATE family efflux transporter [Azohydromonas caseinilytica]